MDYNTNTDKNNGTFSIVATNNGMALQQLENMDAILNTIYRPNTVYTIHEGSFDENSNGILWFYEDTEGKEKGSYVTAPGYASEKSKVMLIDSNNKISLKNHKEILMRYNEVIQNGILIKDTISKLGTSHFFRFIEWEQTVLYEANDIYLEKETIFQNEQSLVRKRVYYNYYKPNCTSCLDYETPIFVVLNGPPYTQQMTRSFCSEIGKYYECVSIDCISVSRAGLYGDHGQQVEDDKLNQTIDGRYNIFDWVPEIRACANIILDILKKTPNAASIAPLRKIIIISDLYTSYYATVLAGSSILKEYNSDVLCLYLSSAVLPFVNNVEHPEENAFCISTSQTASLSVDNMMDSLYDYTESIIPLKSTREFVNNKIYDNYLILNETFIKDSVLNISLKGVPEKACWLIKKARSYEHFETVFDDLKNVVFARAKQIFMKLPNEYKQPKFVLLYKDSRSVGELIKRDKKNIERNNEKESEGQHILDEMIQTLSQNVDFVDVTEHPQKAFKKILSVIDYVYKTAYTTKIEMIEVDAEESFVHNRNGDDREENSDVDYSHGSHHKERMRHQQMLEKTGNNKFLSYESVLFWDIFFNDKNKLQVKNQ